MDPQIKRRMVTDIIIYPCTGKEDGDKIFGTEIPLKGYVVPKYSRVVTRSGETIEVSTAVYLDGTDLDKINPDDDILVPFATRDNIKKIIPYPGIQCACELIEVLV